MRLYSSLVSREVSPGRGYWLIQLQQSNMEAAGTSLPFSPLSSLAFGKSGVSSQNYEIGSDVMADDVRWLSNLWGRSDLDQNVNSPVLPEDLCNKAISSTDQHRWGSGYCVADSQQPHLSISMQARTKSMGYRNTWTLLQSDKLHYRRSYHEPGLGHCHLSTSGFGSVPSSNVLGKENQCHRNFLAGRIVRLIIDQRPL